MLLHDKKHTILISPADSKLLKALENLHIEYIASAEISELIEYERYHADMQLLVINNTAFIPENSKDLYSRIKPYFLDVVICKALKNKYPDNVSLNAALIDDKYLFCKESALAAEVRDYCNANNIEIVNVNQGYSRCSMLIIKNSIITADKSIISAAEKIGLKHLSIKQGYIDLKGADYGFIGGASGVIGDTVYFFGDIERHPDYIEIASFIKENDMQYISLSDEKLTDIGGFVTIK